MEKNNCNDRRKDRLSIYVSPGCSCTTMVNDRGHPGEKPLMRNAIYKKQFPTGTWLEVKGLAVQGQLIEIDMEAHKVKK